MLYLFLLLAFLAVAIIVATYISFRITCVRKRKTDNTEATVLSKPAYAPYRERILAARKSFKEKIFQPIYIKSKDGMLLHANVIDNNSKNVIIFFHGYRSSAISDFSLSSEFYEGLGYNIILPDQRAHGKSDGRYISFGNLEKDDCVLWVNEAIKRFGEDINIVLFGLSMGASTVLFASGENLPENVKVVVADCGFSDGLSIVKNTAKNMSKYIPSFLVSIVNFYCRVFAGFDLCDNNTVDCLKNSDLPILFIHGSADTFVPSEMSVRAFESYKGEKELLIVKNAVHGMSYLTDRERYERTVKDFLEKWVK